MYIGLMSGTSADGINAAAVDFESPQPKLIATCYQPFTAELRQKIIALCSPGENEVNRLGELDVLLGKEFAATARALIKKDQLQPHQIHAIGSHGQTIRHHPERKFTLQIGDPNIIAAETGITTIADFRRRDLALGGQGAPLVPAFHHAIFANNQINRAIVNIGGIANITLLPATGTVLGYDTGPGNTLLDAWIMQHQGQQYDEAGKWAQSGASQPALLQRLLSDRFFHLHSPKSTGREYFHLDWLKHSLADEKPADVQATLVDLTAHSIANEIKKHFSCGEMFICGGGAQNRFLLAQLQKAAPEFTVATTEKLGVHPDWVEAMAFAWLAKQTLEKKPGNLKAVTGAEKDSILGGIYFS